MSAIELAANLSSDMHATLLCTYDVRQYTPIPSRIDVRLMPAPLQRPRAGGRVSGLLRLADHVRGWLPPMFAACRDIKPDVIHANNESLGNVPAALVGRRLGIPVVSHQRGFEYPGIPNRCVLRLGLYRHHITISHAVHRNLLGLGAAPSRCTMVYNPVRPPARGAPRDSPDQTNRVRICMCSVLLPWKGHEVLLAAVARVAARVSAPFHLIVAGAAPDRGSDYPASLRRLAANLGIDHLVTFAGHVKDVYALLSQTDVAVHASVSPEPFGRVVAEAMICGLPVVATNGGGPAEIIADGETGLLVPMGDAEAMADALQRLIASPDLRREMGSRAREYALAEFDPKRSANRVMAIYEQMFSRGVSATRSSSR
jgi:glycosyltransferase involved in cell wall biosynthesis